MEKTVATYTCARLPLPCRIVVSAQLTTHQRASGTRMVGRTRTSSNRAGSNPPVAVLNTNPAPCRNRTYTKQRTARIAVAAGTAAA